MPYPWEEDDPVAAMLAKTNTQPVGGPQALQDPEEGSAVPEQEPQEAAKPASNAMGFNPNTAMAQRYSGIVKDYKAQQGETFDKLGQNMPQQFGTAETVDHSSDPEEGPLTPEETAKRLPSDPGEMEQRIRQHTLGYGIPRASKDGYNSYVQASRANDDQKRIAQRERAKVNQDNIARKDNLTMQQMANYNGEIGPGGGAGGGGGPGQGVSRMGGVTFLRGMGHYRPQDTQEAAHSNLLNAQANWMNARPEIGMANANAKGVAEQGKNDRSAAHLAMRKQISDDQIKSRSEIHQIVHQGDPAKLAAAQAATANKIASISQILKMKMAAANEPRGFPGFAKADPSYRDAVIDPATKKPTGEKAEGDFDFYKNALKNEIEHLHMLNPTAEIPDDVNHVIDQITQQ